MARILVRPARGGRDNGGEDVGVRMSGPPRTAAKAATPLVVAVVVTAVVAAVVAAAVLWRGPGGAAGSHRRPGPAPPATPSAAASPTPPRYPPLPAQPTPAVACGGKAKCVALTFDD